MIAPYDSKGDDAAGGVPGEFRSRTLILAHLRPYTRLRPSLTGEDCLRSGPPHQLQRLRPPHISELLLTRRYRPHRRPSSQLRNRHPRRPAHLPRRTTQVTLECAAESGLGRIAETIRGLPDRQHLVPEPLRRLVHAHPGQILHRRHLHGPHETARKTPSATARPQPPAAPRSTPPRCADA